MSSFWADVFAHAAFFIGFLPMFYFAYVVPVQGNALVNDFFALLKDELTDMQLTLNPNVEHEIEQGVETIAKQEETSKTLGVITEDNPKVFKLTMLVVAIVVPVFLITACVLQYRAGGSIWDLFLGNLIVISFIAISEFAIIGVFVGNFVEVDKDFAKAILLYQTMTTSASSYQECTFVYEFAVSKFGSYLADMFLDRHLPRTSYTGGGFVGPGGTRPMIGPSGTPQMLGPGGTAPQLYRKRKT